MLQSAHPSAHPHQYLPAALLGAALREAGLEPAVVDDVLDRMDGAGRAAATELMLAVLDSEEAAGHVSALDPATQAPRSLHDVLHHAQHGEADTAGCAPVAFRFAATFKELFFPIAGLAATMAATAPAPGDPDAFAAFWHRLMRLRPPHDDAALAVARAVGTLAMRATHAYGELAPATADIASETGLSGLELAAALRRLAELGVLRNAGWAGGTGDYANPDNRWHLAI